MRLWAEVEVRAKANISRITTKARERAKIKAEVRLREKSLCLKESSGTGHH